MSRRRSLSFGNRSRRPSFGYSGYGRNRPHRIGFRRSCNRYGYNKKVGHRTSGGPLVFLPILIVPAIPFIILILVGIEFDPLVYLGPLIIAGFVVLLFIIVLTNSIIMKARKQTQPNTPAHSSSENPIETEQTTDYNSSSNVEPGLNASKEPDVGTQGYIRPIPINCQNCNSGLLKTDLFCFECGERAHP